MAESLPSKYEALSSNAGTAKKIKSKKKSRTLEISCTPNCQDDYFLKQQGREVNCKV
jgi:hypothetical protein